MSFHGVRNELILLLNGDLIFTYDDYGNNFDHAKQ